MLITEAQGIGLGLIVLGTGIIALGVKIYRSIKKSVNDRKTKRMNDMRNLLSDTVL